MRRAVILLAIALASVPCVYGITVRTVHELPLDAATFAAHWRRVDTSTVADSAVLPPLHVYLDVDAVSAEQRAAAARCNKQPAASAADASAQHSARARCVAAALAPQGAELAALRAWLAPLGPVLPSHDAFLARGARGCHFGWHAVHCRGATAAGARAAFGAELQLATLEPVGGDAGDRAVRVHATGRAAVPAALARRVSHVGGLWPAHRGEQVARHAGRRLSKPSASSASTSSSSQSWPSFKPTAWNAIGTVPGNSPLVVSIDERFNVYFVLQCKDGTTPSLSPTSLTTMCGSAANSPRSVNVRLGISTPMGASNAAQERFQLTLGNVQDDCVSSQRFEPSTVQQYHLVCRVLAPGSLSVPAWAQLTANVNATWADGTVAQSTSLPFFDGTVYQRGSDDINSQELQFDANPFTNTQPGQSIMPTDIWRMYDVSSSMRDASGMVQGVVEFSGVDNPGQGLNRNDVQYYLVNLAGQPTSAISKLITIGDTTIVSQGETTLDIEVMMGTAPGATTYVYCLSYGANGGEYATYADALAAFAGNAMTIGDAGVASVWSISYGGPEWGTRGNVDPLMLHINSLLERVSRQGTTVLASSGDTGAYFYTHSTVQFGPNWPASSPHVVGVGATALYDAAPSGTATTPTEIACSAANGNVITSGGGTSAVFDMPVMQRNAAPNSNGATMRQVPDVSAIGAWIQTAVHGDIEPMFGTSASSPITGALITLLNRQRSLTLERDGNQSSFLARVPSFLYNTYVNGAPGTFTDITLGDNCAGEPIEAGLTFAGNYPAYSGLLCDSVQTGYDPVTGLGTPRFALLKDAAAQWAPPDDDAGTNSHAAEDGVTRWLDEHGNTLWGIAFCVAAAIGLLLLIVFRRRVRRMLCGPSREERHWGAAQNSAQAATGVQYAQQPLTTAAPADQAAQQGYRPTPYGQWTPGPQQHQPQAYPPPQQQQYQGYPPQQGQAYYPQQHQQPGYAPQGAPYPGYQQQQPPVPQQQQQHQSSIVEEP